MLYVDVQKFWKDDELAHINNCFSSEAPQVALGIRMSDECVFAELGVPGKPWGYTPFKTRIELNKRYNDKAEKIVGLRLLNEDLSAPNSDTQFPKIKSLEDIFEGKLISTEETSWLEGPCNTPQTLEKLLNRVDLKRENLREFVYPPNWEAEKKRIFNNYGLKPSLLRSIRGPITLAMSLYGVENLIFLLLDEPDLAKRFSDTISDVLFDLITIMDEEAGFTTDNFPSGFSFYDDNCCMLNASLYKDFGYPILKRIFDRWSPKPDDWRYQHSDSAMGHLLPILSTLNLSACNFGPTLTVTEIRKHMPRTRIDGQLAPFTFMNNDEKAIIEEVKRDCQMAKEHRGLNISTAGSINNGSLLTSMRAVMYAIQNYGRY
jgi:uroporphyrinogen decarboxylase